MISKHWNSYGKIYLWKFRVILRLQITQKYVYVIKTKWHTGINFVIDSYECLILRWRVIQQQFWMKECDGLGGQNIPWPSYVFLRDQDTSTTRIYISGNSVDTASLWDFCTARRRTHFYLLTYLRCYEACTVFAGEFHPPAEFLPTTFELNNAELLREKVDCRQLTSAVDDNNYDELQRRPSIPKPVEELMDADGLTARLFAINYLFIFIYLMWCNNSIQTNSKAYKSTNRHAKIYNKINTILYTRPILYEKSKYVL